MIQEDRAYVYLAKHNIFTVQNKKVSAQRFPLLFPLDLPLA